MSWLFDTSQKPRFGWWSAGEKGMRRVMLFGMTWLVSLLTVLFGEKLDDSIALHSMSCTVADSQSRQFR